ncbi:uncharacterized protein JCM6883_003727 [Sporobolomyces salmoneus]|uniref:uncharacterized protein n=1 Tax=Sporobolomyces salmoneus TaxID=183962 RepID=UPI00316B077B
MRAKRKTRRPQIDHEQAAVEGDPKEIERDDGIDSNQWNPFQLPTRSSSGSPQPFLFPVVYEWPVFKMPSSLEPPRVVKPFG